MNEPLESPSVPRTDAPLVIAIDGPSGVGKSTAARRLARRLEVPYLNTGAMYRAVALEALESGVNPDDEKAVADLAERIDLALDLDPGDGGARVLLDGDAVGERIRSPEVGETSSRLSTHPEIRRRLVALQQEFARRHGGVLEGRDIGTRVFPETPHKFFLDARQEVRYRRRYDELAAAGSDVSYGEVTVEIDRRDQRDAHREESPLTYDESYTLIDTSDLAPDEVVDRMVEAIGGSG